MQSWKDLLMMGCRFDKERWPAEAKRINVDEEPEENEFDKGRRNWRERVKDRGVRER